MPRISEDFLKRFTLGARADAFVRDSGMTGFCVRFRRKADGSVLRTFLLVTDRALDKGAPRRRKFNIGDAPEWTVEAARKEAAAMLRALDRGDDPAAQRANKKAQPLFPDLVAEFETRHFPELKSASRRGYRSRIDRVLMPAFETVRVRDVSAVLIRDMVRRKRANPTDANRALAVLSSMMRE